MIFRSKISAVLVIEVILAVLFSSLMKQNVSNDCSGLVEGFLPYYLNNPSACGSNSELVLAYFSLSIIPFIYLLFDVWKSFKRPKIVAWPIFLIINIIVIVNILTWIGGQSSREFATLDQLHNGMFFWPTVTLAGSILFNWLSIIFLVKDQHQISRS